VLDGGAIVIHAGQVGSSAAPVAADTRAPHQWRARRRTPSFRSPIGCCFLLRNPRHRADDRRTTGDERNPLVVRARSRPPWADCNRTAVVVRTGRISAVTCRPAPHRIAVHRTICADRPGRPLVALRAGHSVPRPARLPTPEPRPARLSIAHSSWQPPEMLSSCLTGHNGPRTR
jgi:hypothetical protein